MALPRVSMVQFLMQKGFLKPEQLEEAQKVQTQTGQVDLGKVLVSLNMVGEREVLMAQAQERGIGFVDLDRISVESTATNVVPERLVKAHTALPVRKDGQTLWVAMSNPSNIAALDDIRLASGCRVIPVMAVPGAIDDAIKKYYGGGIAAPEGAPAAAAPVPVAAPVPAGERPLGRHGGGRPMNRARSAHHRFADAEAGPRPRVER